MYYVRVHKSRATVLAVFRVILRLVDLLARTPVSTETRYRMSYRPVNGRTDTVCGNPTRRNRQYVVGTEKPVVRQSNCLRSVTSVSGACSGDDSEVHEMHQQIFVHNIEVIIIIIIKCHRKRRAYYIVSRHVVRMLVLHNNVTKNIMTGIIETRKRLQSTYAMHKIPSLLVAFRRRSVIKNDVVGCAIHFVSLLELRLTRGQLWYLVTPVKKTRYTNYLSVKI